MIKNEIKQSICAIHSLGWERWTLSGIERCTDLCSWLLLLISHCRTISLNLYKKIIKNNLLYSEHNHNHYIPSSIFIISLMLKFPPPAPPPALENSYSRPPRRPPAESPLIDGYISLEASSRSVISTGKNCSSSKYTSLINRLICY